MYGLQACKPGVNQALPEEVSRMVYRPVKPGVNQALWGELAISGGEPAVWFTVLQTKCKPSSSRGSQVYGLQACKPNVNQALTGGASRMVDRTGNRV